MNEEKIKSQLDALVTVAQTGLSKLHLSETIVKSRMDEVKRLLTSIPNQSTDVSDNSTDHVPPVLSQSSINAPSDEHHQEECVTSKILPEVIHIEGKVPKEVHIRKITSDTSAYVDMCINNVPIPMLIQ